MRITLLFPTVIAACIVPNPAFNLSDGHATTGLTTGLTSEPTTGLTTTATPTTGPLTTTELGTTGPIDPGTGTAAADATTGGAQDCWSQGADGWPLIGTPLTAFQDFYPADPFITPDGLRLYYVALMERRPFLTTRASRDMPFANGTPLVVWNSDPAYVPTYPALVLGEQEMLMSNLDDIAFSVYQGGNFDKYTKPTLITGPNTDKREQHLTATADGEVLIVARQDGDPLPPFFPGGAPRFHQFTRSDPKPGDAFTGDTDVSPQVGTLHLTICPVLSPDGLRLFFSSTEVAVLDDNNVDASVGIYFTTRDARDAPWGPATRIAIVSDMNGSTCPSSVTADGCELAYHQFRVKGGDYHIFLASRSP